MTKLKLFPVSQFAVFFGARLQILDPQYEIISTSCEIIVIRNGKVVWKQGRYLAKFLYQLEILRVA